MAAGRLAVPSCPGDLGAPRRLLEAGNVGPGGSGCRKGAPGSNTRSGQDRSEAKHPLSPAPSGAALWGPGRGEGPGLSLCGAPTRLPALSALSRSPRHPQPHARCVFWMPAAGARLPNLFRSFGNLGCRGPPPAVQCAGCRQKQGLWNHSHNWSKTWQDVVNTD